MIPFKPIYKSNCSCSADYASRCLFLWHSVTISQPKFSKLDWSHGQVSSAYSGCGIATLYSEWWMYNTLRRKVHTCVKLIFYGKARGHFVVHIKNIKLGFYPHAPDKLRPRFITAIITTIPILHHNDIFVPHVVHDSIKFISRNIRCDGNWLHNKHRGNTCQRTYFNQHVILFPHPISVPLVLLLYRSNRYRQFPTKNVQMCLNLRLHISWHLIQNSESITECNIWYDSSVAEAFDFQKVPAIHSIPFGKWKCKYIEGMDCF